MSPKRNFVEALSFNYKLSKFFGLFPFTIYYNRVFDTKTTRTDILILIFWSIFYGYDCFNVFSKSSEPSKYSSTVYIIGIAIIDKCAILTQICVIWMNFVYRKKTAKILRNIDYVDQQV